MCSQQPRASSSTSDINMIYNPDQPEGQVRQIRKGYRGELDKLGSNPNETTVDQLSSVVKSANGLFEQVTATAEATMDSGVLIKVSEAGIQKARAMKSGSGAFDMDEFISKLITFMDGRKGLIMGEDDDDADDGADDGTQLDWGKLGRKAMSKSARVPVMDFMLGPLSIEQKKRAIVKRAKFEKNKADEKKPQNITEEDITRSENETTKNVLVLRSVLHQTGEINIFRFIVNPHDFGQSVENMFYLSFLIRDGDCAFSYPEVGDNIGQPCVWLCDKPTQADYEDGLKKQQIVMELDMATWKRAIEVFDIKEPTIPQRPKAQTRIGKKWYG